jgi:hypothetical protein
VLKSLLRRKNKLTGASSFLPVEGAGTGAGAGTCVQIALDKANICATLRFKILLLGLCSQPGVLSGNFVMWVSSTENREKLTHRCEQLPPT